MKEALNLQPNIADPDTFYAELIAMQNNLDDDTAQAAMSELLLVYANHIGNMKVLREGIALIKKEHEKTEQQ